MATASTHSECGAEARWFALGHGLAQGLLAPWGLALPHAAPARSSPRYPYVTGTSVIGITYRDGIMIACDTLG